MKSGGGGQNFSAVFDALKNLVAPYEARLKVTQNTPKNYWTYTLKPSPRGGPVIFAAVISKSYVAFHLFPVYMFADLLNDISPELKQRMQGKSCWNFKKPDEKLFAELGALVRASFDRFEKNGLV